ncbi:putative Ig domain-containing protein [Piscinibacter sakaiensis]|uniref:putative Ig domain-containing protein n=1 Tax=Piscinibacter sakaiensis TaxID=1547922 RepID=UPI003AAE9841
MLKAASRLLRRPIVEAMEERVLHSADLSPLQLTPQAAAVDSYLQQHAAAAESADPLAHTREIAFVDASLPDAQQLIADLLAQRDAGRVIDVVEIAADADGIALIGEVLAGRSDIGAVHLLVHGSDGAVRLGAVKLDGLALLQRADEIARWAVALTADADLLLYGCEVAGSELGVGFVKDLAMLTGADVAASSDLTGAAALGGNWQLEVRSGAIEAGQALSLQQQGRWQGLLATYIADPAKTDGSTGSLRWAITQANANPGIDTVRLLAGTHRLTLNGIDNTNLLGDLDITGDIVFIGATQNAADTVIQSQVPHRVFDLLAGTASFSNLTISGGGGAQQGGGLNIAAGASATLVNVVFSGNSGSTGGAIHNAGLLTLEQVTLAGNSATQGGGLYNAGSATITASAISGNTATSGAGIFGAAGSSFSGSNLTISGNTASGSGGGLLVNGNGYSLTSATIASNSAASGGGIWSAAGSAASLRNTILASNIGGNANQLQSSAGFNVATDGSAFAGTGSDLLTSADALRLGALAANGGLTKTHALLGGSVAIDRGATSVSLIDQRGAARAGAADAGAFEATAIVAQNGSIFFNAGSGYTVTVPGAANDAVRLELEVTNGTLDLAQTLGPEFQVNTTTLKDQRTPAIAVAADGHYVVVWVSDGQDGSKDGVYARVYNADGSARSGEIAVNTTTNDAQNAPAVAIDGSGRFVVAWQSYDAGKLTYDIYARSFDANGAPISAQKRITSNDGDQIAPSVAIDAAGNVVIVYSGKGDEKNSDKDGIYARTSTITLATIAPEFIVNTTTVGVQTLATVASHAGGFVVAWQSAGQDGSGNGIYAQRYDSAGVRLGGEFRVNLTTVGDQKTPSIATNTAGEFVVAWESANQDSSGLGVIARRFDAAGNPLTGEVLVNSTTANDQFDPSIVLADDGRFAVAWTSTAQDHADGKQGVYLRSFAADGSPISLEILVNSVTVDEQAAPSLGIAADGRMVAVWHSRLQDGNGYGVHGQRFLQPGALRYLVGDGLADARIVVTGSVADINQALDTLRFLPTPGFRGAANLAVTATDLGSGVTTASFSVPIDVQKVNAAPTLMLPPAQATAEDTAVVFSAANGNAIVVADVDADPLPLQLTLSATNGSVTLASMAGLSIVGGANGAATVVVQGRLADLNAALDGLLLQPAADYFGAATLTVIVDDLGHSTVGGPLSASGSVALTISSVNDAPVNVAPATASVIEGSTLVFSTANGNVVRITDVDVGSGNVEVTLSSTMGTLKLARTNNLSFIFGSGRGGEDRISFRGTLANVNIALDGLEFTPLDDYAGPAFIEILSNDLAGSGSGGALVDRDLIAVHVVPDSRNDAPVITDPGNQVTVEETPLVFSTATGNPLSVADDADGLPIKVTLTVSSGTLTLGTSTGGEFVVNSTTASDQQATDVAMAPTGERVVVWQSKDQDGSGQGIYLQRYSKEGLLVGLETRVNATTLGDQMAPSVAIARDGSFVVVWASVNGNSPANGVYSQRFAADGSRIGGETRVSSWTGSIAAPSVAIDAVGNFVVTWQSKDQDGDGLGIYARRVAANGTPLGGEFRVNTTTTKDQSAPAIAMADGGAFIVTWQGKRPGADDWMIYAQRFDAAGAAAGSEFAVATVTYKDQMAPAIAADAAGNFVIAWQSKDVDYNDGKFGIYAQRFAADGSQRGVQFLVNTRTPNEQTAAAVTMNKAGDFAIAWQSKNQDSRDDDAGIYAQRYLANGSREGGEFRVNTTVVEAQTAPALGMSDDGQLLITWTSDKQDGSGRGIFGQRYIDARSLNFLVGDGSDDATMVFLATIDQINDVLDGLIYTPAKDFADKATLTITVDDLGRTGTGGAKVSTTKLTINVTAVNDPPVIKVPPRQVFGEDAPIVFSTAAGRAITVADPDADTKKLLVTIRSQQGLVTLGTLQGLQFTLGDGTADATMTFTATLVQLNNALNGLSLQMPTQFTGDAAIEISVDDQGNVGTGGALRDNAVVLLTVVPGAVNAAPKVVVPAPQRTAVDTALILSTAAPNLLTVIDDSGNSPVRVTLTVSNGTATLDGRLGTTAIANTTTLGEQNEARIAMLPDGSHLVVWTSNAGGALGRGIFAQRFDASGARLGGQIGVNTWIPADQLAPVVAADPAAGYVVAWVSDNQDGSGRGIYVQRLDLAGQKIGVETRVNTTISGDQVAPGVALTASGAFVVVWQSADASGEGIYMQRFDANGQQAGDETLVNVVTANDQTVPVVAMDGSGNFVVAWQGRDADGSGILARRFDAAGNALGGEFVVNSNVVDSQVAPRLAMNAAGQWVAVWQGRDSDNNGIVARRFDAAGNPLGSEFLVNLTTAGQQTAPTVAINDSGALAFAWQSSDGGGGNGQGIFSRSFSAGGVGGLEQRVNIATAGDQLAPAIGLAANGVFRIAYSTDNLDGDKSGIGLQTMQRQSPLVFTSGDGVDDAVMVFTGTLADINAALDGLVFKPNLGFIGVARVSLTVEDLGATGSGGPMSGSDGVDIVVGNAPLLDLDVNDSSGATGADYKANFRTGLGPVLIADLDATITDPNSANLQRLTVRITNQLDGAAEVLAANIAGTAIIANYNAATGTLLLTGSNSVANYQKVLRTVTYNNTAATPTTTPRLITFVAWDGSGDSNIGTTTLRYAGANIEPVGRADAYAVQKNGSLSVVGADGVLANDSDADGDRLTAVLVSTAANGALTLNADGSFSYTPNAGFSGSDGFSYRANDGLADSAVTAVSISVNAVNAAPSGADTGLAMLEDGVLTITRADFGFSDTGDSPPNAMAGVLIDAVPADGTLRLYGAVVAAGSFIDIADIDAGGLVYRPAADASGSVAIGFQVRDDGGTDNGGIDTDPTVRWLTITIAAVPDAPVLQSALPDRAATQDLLFDVSLDPSSFTDADPGDMLTWSASLSGGGPLPGWLGFDPATLRFTGTPRNADVGTITVRVTATDTTARSAFGEFAIVVADVNDAPILATPLPDQSAPEGSPFNYSIGGGHFVDIDAGDVLGFTATLAGGGALPDWLAFDAATRSFSGTPGNADVGAITIRVTATDLAGASVFDDFLLTVAAVNDAPTLVTPLPDASAVENLPFSLVIDAASFADADADAGDVLTFSASLAGGAALPAWLSFDAATLRFSGTPLNADVGVWTVRVTATDLAGASVFDDFLITVDNVNDAPMLSAPLPDQAATQDVAFAFTVGAGTFVDIDADDVLSITATQASGAALPSWLSFDAATRSFSGTPRNADVGSITVRVTATDSSLASVHGDFVLTVANVNDAPTLARPIANKGATLGVPFVFTLPADSFADVDAGDVLTLAAKQTSGAALPGWLSFDASTRTLSGTPGVLDLGPVNLRFTATDLAGASVDADFTLTVVPLNSQPVLVNPLADKFATQAVVFSFTVPADTFSDPDLLDSLSFDATRTDGSALPAWLVFDAATRTFSGTPANSDVGTISVRVEATDNGGASVFDDFTLTVANVNDAPTLDQPLVDQSATQDLPFAYVVPLASFSDIDAGDTLVWSATLASGAALPAWLGFDAATRTFSGTPTNAEVGVLTVRVTVTDGSLANAFDEFVLTVSNVNDAPTLVLPLPDQAASQGSPFVYSVDAASFVDIDAGDGLFYSASQSNGNAMPSWLSFDAASRTFSGTPGNGDVGVVSLRVTATDGAGASIADDFLLTVANVNDAPVLVTPLANQSATQDLPFASTVPSASFTDIDAGDVLTWSATLANGAALPAWLSFDAATRTFAGTPGNADVGIVSVRVTVTDLALASAFGDFTLSIANVNDAPTLVQPLADQAAAQDLPFVYTVPAASFADIDAGDMLTWSATLANGAALPAWLSFDAATKTFSGTPANGDVGIVSVRVTVTDLALASAFGDFTLSIANVNDAPVLAQPLADQAATQDLPFSYTVPVTSFADIDAGDVLTWSATLSNGSALPIWLSFDAATRTFSGTPANGDVGVLTVRVTATDLALASASGDFTLTVANVNDAPVLAQPLADQAATQDLPFAFTVPSASFTDIDVGDVLTWSATLSNGAALPAWLSFDAATRTFAGTPGNSDVGIVSVRVTVTDLALASASGDFKLTVANVNDAPTLVQPLTDQAATQDLPFVYTVPAASFADIDAGDVLTWSATLSNGSALPAWLGFNAASRTFSGMPGNADVGLFTVRITVTDAALASAFGDLTLTVANVNDAPTLTRPIPDQRATKGVPFAFTFAGDIFADVDAGDLLIYSATLSSGAALPGWLLFDAATRTLSGTPAASDVGTVGLRITATDIAGTAVNADFSLDVAAVNAPPVLAVPLADASATEDMPFAFTVPAGTFTDPDLFDTLLLSATRSNGSALPGWLVFDAATRSFSGTPGNADVGVLALRVTATNHAGASVFDDFLLTVANVNDAPVRVSPLADQSATQDLPFVHVVPVGTFTDIDAGDTLAWSATLADGSALPAWLLFDAATRSFSGTPGNADVGTLTVRVTVSDAALASAFGDFTLTVANVNDAPTLVQPLADQSATQDLPFAFTVPMATFADIDAGDTLVWSATLADGLALPAWLLFDAATRSFSGTPGNADVGTLAIRVTVTDAALASASGDFKLTVANVNDAPILLAPLPDQIATEDQPFAITIDRDAFADIDAGDRLVFSATLADGSALPGWLRFDAATLRFSGTPGIEDGGATWAIDVIAADAAGASVASRFQLQVLGINHAPRLALPIDGQKVTANERLLMKLPPATFVDPDAGDVLVYRATLLDGSALPRWLRFDPVELSFSGQPARADVGRLAVRIIATDAAGALAQAVFVVDVADVRALPEAFQPVFLEPEQNSARAASRAAISEPPAAPPAARGLVAAPADAAGRAAAAEKTSLLAGTVAEFRSLAVERKVAAGDESMRTGSRSDAILAALPAAQFDELQVHSMSRLLLSDDLLGRFDDLHHQMQDLGEQQRRMLASSLAISSGLSLGYVVWLIRGGVLVSSMLSALPAWQLIDPMPVLAAGGAGARTRGGRWFGGADTADGDEVEKLFERKGSKKPPQPVPTTD